MNVWHATPDTPRLPLRVAPGERVRVRVGTWPIAPGQSVTVIHRVVHADGTQHEGTATATWEQNDSRNSYFVADLGPFTRGDVVTYGAEARDGAGAVSTPSMSFRVGPKIYLALLWHQHQPLYREGLRGDGRPRLRQPWVRLHAVRDYYAMAALVAEHPRVHLTINLTPSLVAQIEDYTERSATDAALDLTLKPVERLSADDRERMLTTFFDADWHRQVFPHPRYAELFAKRTTGGAFSEQDLRDLQAWFNLAWFGKEFRDGEVRLVTGEVVSVHGFVRRGRDFRASDVRRIVEEQFKVLRAVIPIHRQLQQRGQLEVSTTPYYHPILPLLVDSDRATIDLPGASYPPRFAHPEDAEAQVGLACDQYEGRFGRRPRGMWPAEGAVGQFVVPFFAGAGLKWIASDGGVLASSGRWGYDTRRADVLCRPYQAREGDRAIAIFFRDTALSDAIGFHYAAWPDAGAAARSFVTDVKQRFIEHLASEEDRVLTVALDGENAWGAYADDARPFLEALYGALADDEAIATVTFAEYLDGNAERGIVPHPLASLERVHDLFTGSWIAPYGSTRVDLGTWIGQPEKNRAWRLLGSARDEAAARGATRLSNQAAFDALLAAEGSDWFWWFGEGHDSGHNDLFDDLFRTHVAEVYRAIGRPTPPELSIPISERAVVWSPVRSIETVSREDAIVAQTNCPGKLLWSINDGPLQKADMKPVGGAMAAIERHQLRLGPFGPEARTVSIRFHCTHPACDCQQPCCRSDAYRVVIE